MFEIGYLTLGRSAIFFICIEIWIVAFFLTAIYINIWSGTALQIVSSIAGDVSNLPTIF